MEELVALVVWIIVAWFKLLFWLVKLVLRPFRARSESPRPVTQAAPLRTTHAAAPRPPAPKGLSATVKQALLARADALTARASTIAAQAAEQAPTERFARPIVALEQRGGAITQRVRRGVESHAALDAALAREETLLAILDEMIGERRGPFGDLLGDTDALADASYAPIVEFCVNRGIPLSSDRAATMVGGDKLFFLSIDEPTGLAAIVLPESFAEEITTWPAIAHEIAHDFFRSVRGLPSELRQACALGDDVRLAAAPSTDAARFMADLVQRSANAWVEELFADAFGTMMLGPAYIETMIASFASPEKPAIALAVMAADSPAGPVYEEHPPGHVRVVVGCRLLARMGYGKEADRLERAWRARHGEPTVLYVPLPNGRWVSLAEDTLVERSAVVGEVLYLTGLPCLRGQPLRSLAMLDFGPRENEQARRVASRFSTSQPVRTRDPRLLVAGAVLATVASPSRAAEIYALAREAIVGVGARARQSATALEEGPLGSIDATAVREALVLGTVMASRRAR